MKYIAAYLLLTIGGNASPSASDITELLTVADVSVDAEQVEKVISELSGKDINTLISEGASKLASVPSGGGGGGGGSAPAAATGGAAPAAAEEKKEEKAEEKEESDDDMGFGLFD